MCARELVSLSEPVYYVRGNQSGGFSGRICWSESGYEVRGSKIDLLETRIMCAGTGMAG